MTAIILFAVFGSILITISVIKERSYSRLERRVEEAQMYISKLILEVAENYDKNKIEKKV